MTPYKKTRESCKGGPAAETEIAEIPEWARIGRLKKNEKAF